MLTVQRTVSLALENLLVKSWSLLEVILDKIVVGLEETGKLAKRKNTAATIVVAYLLSGRNVGRKGVL